MNKKTNDENNKFDADISKTCEVFHNLIQHSINYVEILLTFNQVLQPNQENINNNILDKVDKHAEFWKSIEDSLLKGLLMNLRVIFGNSSDSNNFSTFINDCRNNKLLEFSLENIKKRKSSVLNDTDLANYLENPEEITVECFDGYSKKIKPSKSKRKKMMSFINDNFTHINYKNIHNFKERFYEFFKEVDLFDIREILYIAKLFNDNLRFMYHNGKEQYIEVVKIDTPKNDTTVQKSLKELINNTQLSLEEINAIQQIKSLEQLKSANLYDVDLEKDKNIN